MKELKKIRTDKIDKRDNRFIIKADNEISSLELPVFFEEGDRYIPIKKYSINARSIDAFVYGPESRYSDIIKDMISSLEMNIFERAAIVEKLEIYDPGFDKREWARSFHISTDKWEDLKALVRYESEWQVYFVDKKTPLKRISHFKDNTLRQILEPLLKLNPGINILESIANLLTEIGHKEKADLKEIWSELKMSNIHGRDDAPAQIILKQIKERLYSKRFPTISRYRQELNEHLRTIPRTAGMDLRSDENFETPGMQLQADLRSKQDIEKLQNWLEEQKPELEKIMDIQKGNKEQ